MKGHLYPRICEYRTLWKAWNKVRTGGASGGIDGMTPHDFENGVEHRIRELSERLASLSYIPEPGMVHYVEKPGSSEKRKIVLPSIRDKIVQEAVRSTIEPLFESMFKPSSFAYRPGRGPKLALAALDKALRDHPSPWVASADIHDYFDCIDHNLLLNLVSARVWEEEVLHLIELWLKMGLMSGLTWSAPESGIPQGAVISPLLSNIYLHEFDCRMEKEGLKLIRYADDFVLVEGFRRKAETALRIAEDFLEERLFLRLNQETKSVRALYEGFPFLGFIHKSGVKLISDEKLAHIKDKIRKIIRSSRDLEEINRKLSEAVRGWREYYGSGDCDEQFSFLDRFILGELKVFFGRNPYSLRKLKEELDGLEFFATFGERDKKNLISLALAGSRLSKGKASGKGPETLTVKKKVEKKKREYARRLLDSSVLVASSPGSFLGKTSKRAILKVSGKKEREVPFFALRHIMVASPGVSISSDLIRHCAENGIPVTYVDHTGKPYAHVLSPAHPLYRYTAAQAAALSDARGVHLARCFAEGKIRNQINLLKYYRKYSGRRSSLFDEGSGAAIEEMQALLKKLAKIAEGSDENERKKAKIFGIEGQSAACYWRQVKSLLGDRAYFTGREKKGASDLVNSLLNYGYGILYSQIFQAVLLAGLDPNIGFLHKEQPGKPVLVFDLIEEFRQPVVDKTVIALVNKGRRLGMSGVYLDFETRELLIRQVYSRLEKKTIFRGTAMSYRSIITHQVKALADYLDGGRKYRPFIDRW